jgi:bifunctional non-homologous end joining protein LigD
MSILDALPGEIRSRAKRSRQPEWITPMLATLTDDYFSDPAWLFERKLDGERCLVFRKGRRLELLSRTKEKLNSQYPELIEVFSHQSAENFVLDGEIVAFGRGGQTSFARLQRRMHVRNPSPRLVREVPAYFYAFDLVHAGGHDLTDVPLIHRKAIMKGLLTFESRLRYTTHRMGRGEEYLAEACRKGWEGLIAKRAESTYALKRSRDWLKFKCVNEQEFVIGGFTDPKGSRQRFGALLIGYYEDGDLVYAGKVGTGFGDKTLDELADRMAPLESKDAQFDRGALPRRDVHWLKPRLVAQIGFSEWTRDGQLRHPRFLGLRTDKRARDVTRERPQRPR